MPRCEGTTYPSCGSPILRVPDPVSSSNHIPRSLYELTVVDPQVGWNTREEDHGIGDGIEHTRFVFGIVASNALLALEEVMGKFSHFFYRPEDTVLQSTIREVVGDPEVPLLLKSTKKHGVPPSRHRRRSPTRKCRRGYR